MTPNEVIQLLKLVRAYSPSFAVAEGTSAAWGELLADVPADEANAAVRAHFANGRGPWIDIGQIRRGVADRRGLLPPDPETAYAQADEFNRWLGCRSGPEPPIHPAALATARKIKWSVFDAPPGVAHRRFTDAYRPAAEKAAEQALAGSLAELGTSGGGPKALEGGTGVEAAAVEERARTPIDHAAAERLKTQIARSGIGKLPAPPRPDYPAPTKAEIGRWSAAFAEWAASNGHTIEEVAGR